MVPTTFIFLLRAEMAGNSGKKGLRGDKCRRDRCRSRYLGVPFSHPIIAATRQTWIEARCGR
jgi:hypothetical protein